MAGILAASQGETNGRFARVLLTFNLEHRQTVLTRFQLEVGRGGGDVPRVVHDPIRGPAAPTGDSQEQHPLRTARLGAVSVPSRSFAGHRRSSRRAAGAPAIGPPARARGAAWLRQLP